MKLRNLIGISIAVIGLSASAIANASILYQTGFDDPWGETTNDAAMNAAFGSGNWTKSNGFNLGQFTGASFVFLDGGDSSANQLNSFISANVAALQNYVSNGGRLFINAAPNEGSSFSLGFGVTLDYEGNQFSPNALVTAAGVAAGLTNGGITTTYTGDFFGHAFVSGGGISDLVHGDGGILFGAKNYGNGFVAFGGQTTNNFHNPLQDAAALRVNELLYVANAQTQTNNVPEPATALLVGLGLFGLAARRREKN